MALGTLPYKFRITSFSVEQGNTDTSVFFDVLDGSNTIKGQLKVFIPDGQNFNEVENSIRQRVFDQMAADAGGQSNLLTGLISKIVTVN